MNSKYVIIWEAVFMAYFKALSWNLCWRDWGNHNKHQSG